MEKTRKPPTKPAVVYDDRIDIWFSSDPSACICYNDLFKMFVARQSLDPQLREYHVSKKAYTVLAEIRDLPNGHRVVSIRLSGGANGRIWRKRMRELLCHIRTHTGVLAP